ncbi:MAG: redoxin domain-containing protein [Planctomycetes bacterium]|nr:redoxin domain-containing protein [Planctomycetota bacterium]
MSNRKAMCLFLTLAACWLLNDDAAVSSNNAQRPPKEKALGEKVANTDSLRDVRGNRRSLHGFNGHKAVVLVFLGTECPVANLYLPGLSEIAERFRSRKVQFLGVYANENEDLNDIAAHASDREIPFPVMKDTGQRLSNQLGIKRVPSAVVLDGDFTLRYRGRIDDQYGVSSRRPKASRADLADAIDEVLAGRKVTIAETEADGCLLDRSRRQVKTQVTYARHVAPILQNRCQMCHRPGQVGPFSLLTYGDAVKHSAMIGEVTAQRRMPPWHADPRYGRFSNSRHLSVEEIDVLRGWIEGGLARGDDKDLPSPAKWPQGWVHGEPDLVFAMPEEFSVPAQGVLPYKNWIIDTNFKEDKWVRIAEARPGAPEVVHHVVVYILKEGQRGPVGRDGGLAILVGWAPGDLGLVAPPDTAVRIPKGARLRLEMHYTPNGKAVKDRTAVGLTFSSKPPKFEMLLNEFANMAFEIPPHHPHFKAEATFRIRADARLISLTPHMHWRGKDFRYEVIYPDGKRQTLLSVPRWDFNWQSVYRVEEPLKLPKGAKLHAIAHWDNSVNNPLNPDPSKQVRFGLQSWEEMMVGFAAYVWERPETAAELAKNPPSQADLFFDRLDVNGDDVITAEEIPERLRPLLRASGITLPARLSRAEFARLFEAMRLLAPRKRPVPGKNPS